MNLERKYPIVDQRIWGNPRVQEGWICSFQGKEYGEKYDLHVVDDGMSEPSWVLVISDNDHMSAPLSHMLLVAIGDTPMGDLYRYCVQCLTAFGVFSYKRISNRE
jgi:hypothetical protein